ncbi:DnaB-like helicase N-terminal domain-containing protein, partial [Streptomyces abyssomicinicus]|uniref:DnaB-like helicase N-terminal domain-containing protein n=1 Tax=Streptomyces abyssomicinicus TaxID=574929 RepID=UPI00248334D6
MTVPAQAQAAAFDGALHDEYAEQCVLGGMLLSEDAITDCMEAIKPQQFAFGKHELIYRAVLDLYAKGDPADPLTVGAELTRRGELNKVGGAAYLHALVQTVPTAANASYYAEIARELAVLRELEKAGRAIVTMARAREGELADIGNQAQSLVFAA